MSVCDKCGSITIKCLKCEKPFSPSQPRQVYCTKKCYYARRSHVCKIAKSSEFEEHVRDKIRDRRGSILSTKPVTRSVLRTMGHMPAIQSQHQFKPKVAEMVACYDKVESLFIEFGGEYFGATKQTGKKYKWETVK